MARNYYDTLGVPRNAGDKDIRKAFRRLARKHHPDVNPGDKSAEARFKEINAAYEVLSDAEKRRKYDRYGDQWQYADQIEQAQRQSAGRWSFGRGGTFDSGDVNLGGGAFTVDKDSWGGALQAGFDYGLTKSVFVNFDIKKIWIDTDVKAAATGASVANLKIDPLIVGAGLGWKF